MAVKTTNTVKSSKQRAKKATLGERAAARIKQENQWEQYNSATKFDKKDLRGCLELLSSKTFPSDEINRKAYAEAIAKSLTETLSPEVGIKDFWEAMGKAGCKELKIEDGHLSFYGAKKEKIDITPFTQAIIFEAHSSFYKQRKIERAERIKQAREQLETLISEINKNRRQK